VTRDDPPGDWLSGFQRCAILGCLRDFHPDRHPAQRSPSWSVQTRPP